MDYDGLFLQVCLALNIIDTNSLERRSLMAGSIEYQKQMTEIVYINLPGPQEPTPGMTGGELLHGFLAELYSAPSADVKNYVNLLCAKWNVHYREQRGG
jgi:hypothetical protein